MMLKKYSPYLIATGLFILVALGYFSPVLQGKKLYQSDIVQFKGMSKEIVDFREKYHTEPYWTEAAFSGMPAYQISALYPHDYLKSLDKILRFLPSPADYMFLYMLGFFILMRVLQKDWKIALTGSLAFGLSTYLIIILGVGHNAKAHAIAYMPWVVAGVVLIFRQRFFSGFLLTSLAAGLEIASGHIQMSYYLFFLLLIYGVYFFIEKMRTNDLSGFIKSFAIGITAGILALLMNANHLLPTREYARESTRSPSELTLTPEGKPKSVTGGLSYDYITEYSYGILESFNLFIPRLTGGSNAENIGRKSHTYKFLRDKIGASDAGHFVNNAPMYWGEQPIVAAPAYIGAVTVFLFVLALFVPGIKEKKWLLAAGIFSLLMSWGKNFGFLTDFFIRYVPYYNKFRAVSSIQVILELVVPVLAFLGLSRFLTNTETGTIDNRQKILLKSLYITGGIALFFAILGPSWFSFEATGDIQFEQLKGLPNALIQDRKALMRTDALRSLLFVLLTAGILWLYLREKIRPLLLYFLLGLLIVLDLGGVDKRYVNKEDFVSALKMDKPFPLSQTDREILKDTTYFRVGNFTVSPLNDGTTSYYHKSIGGYHAAKLRRYQELFDYQVNKNNFEILNMLNTKYILFPDEKGKTRLQSNPEAYGNAWFIDTVIPVNNADEEIQALDSINRRTAVLEKRYYDLLPDKYFYVDTSAYVKLLSHKSNELIYQAKTHIPKLAVFSEIYYPYGWEVYIDDKPGEIWRANYVLRALVIPEGEHRIRFIFKPETVEKGAKYSLMGYAILIIFTGLGLILKRKQKG